MKRTNNRVSVLTNELAQRGCSKDVFDPEQLNRKERRKYNKIKRKMEKKGCAS